MKELNVQQLACLNQKLLAQQSELGQLLKNKEADAQPVALDQSAVGRVSRIDAIQQQSMALANRANYLRRFKLVCKALKSIELNEYGYCQQCGELITYARLQLQPEVSFCIVCQTKSENV